MEEEKKNSSNDNHQGEPKGKSKIEERVKALEDSIEELKRNENKVKWILSIVAAVFVIGIFLLIFQPSDYRKSVNRIESGALQNRNMCDSMYFSNIREEIKLEIFKYDTLNKVTNKNLTNELQKNLFSNIEKRNDAYLKEMEKANGQMMKNVLIINLIGRYVVILCCIAAFILVLKIIMGRAPEKDIF